MRKKWIFFSGIVLLVLIGAWLFNSYQKPRTGVENRAAAYTLSAEQLYQEFTANEATANQKYVGKVLVVNGVVAEVQQMGGAANIILAAAAAGGVQCSLKEFEKQSLPVKGSRISVKGRCTGYLMDVALVDAVVLK